MNYRRHRDPRRRLAEDPPTVDLDGDVTFRAAWGLAVPAAGGVYLIRDLRGLLYVGRSDDLRVRFHQHLAHSHNELLRIAIQHPWGDMRFGWIRHDVPAELEKSLIARLLPICNEHRYSSPLDLLANHR